MKTEIVQHIRENGNPVATLLGRKDPENGIVCIGYSKCNTKYDTFNKKKGIMIARGRAKVNISDRQIPFVVEENLPYFIDRCERYFKKSA